MEDLLLAVTLDDAAFTDSSFPHRNDLEACKQKPRSGNDRTLTRTTSRGGISAAPGSLLISSISIYLVMLKLYILVLVGRLDRSKLEK